MNEKRMVKRIRAEENILRQGKHSYTTYKLYEFVNVLCLKLFLMLEQRRGGRTGFSSNL